MSRRKLSLTRRPSSCFWMGGRSCPNGCSCGGCCKKSSPGRRLRTKSPKAVRNRRSGVTLQPASNGRRTDALADGIDHPDSPVAEAAATMVREKVGSASSCRALPAGILTESRRCSRPRHPGGPHQDAVYRRMTKDPRQGATETTGGGRRRPDHAHERMKKHGREGRAAASRQW